MKPRVISVFICIMLLFSGCTGKGYGPGSDGGPEFSSLHPTPELTYEVPVSMPNILINQIGYTPSGEKTVIFRGTRLPDSFEIIDEETGETVYNGTVRQKPEADGSLMGYGDFTDLTEEGTYYVRGGILGRSYNFVLSDAVYDELFPASLALLKRRQEKKINVILSAGTNETEEKILQGGWFTDSFDNQNVKTACEAVMVLLTAYELYPSAFLSGSDSAAKEPEILKLIRRQMEWLMLLQEEKSGGVYGGIRADTQDNPAVYQMEPVSLEASAGFAAAMAKFSYIYQSFDQKYAAECLKAADLAWKYIDRQPDAPEETEGIAGILFSAAAELYRASGRQAYHTKLRSFLEKGVDPGNVTWDTFGVFTYLSTRKPVNKEYCGVIMKQLMNYAEEVSLRAREGAYFTEGNKDLDNTKDLLWNMVILSIADYVITNHEYDTVIENHLHYFLGCNPQAVCFLDAKGSDRLWKEGGALQEDLLSGSCYICMLSHILKEDT